MLKYIVILLTVISIKAYADMGYTNSLYGDHIIPYLTEATSTNGGNAIAFSSHTITTANSYQQIVAAGSCIHGGIIENDSAANNISLWIDWTSSASSGLTTITNGAIRLTPPANNTSAGSIISIPATSNAVFIFAIVTANASFRGSCS